MLKMGLVVGLQTSRHPLQPALLWSLNGGHKAPLSERYPDHFVLLGKKTKQTLHRPTCLSPYKFSLRQFWGLPQSRSFLVFANQVQSLTFESTYNCLDVAFVAGDLAKRVGDEPVNSLMCGRLFRVASLTLTATAEMLWVIRQHLHCVCSIHGSLSQHEEKKGGGGKKESLCRWKCFQVNTD